MRDLNEYKEEIFRRGEEKIRIRKRRNARMLTGMASLGLCLILCGLSLFFLPQEKTGDRDILKEAENLAQSPSAEGGLSVEVVVSDSVYPLEGMNAEQISQLCFSIETAFSKGDGDANGALSDNTASGVGEESSPQIAPNTAKPPQDDMDHMVDGDYNYKAEDVNGIPQEYRITLTDENGAKKIYVLCGNVLTEEETGKEAVLSDEEREELLACLNGLE